MTKQKVTIETLTTTGEFGITSNGKKVSIGYEKAKEGDIVVVLPIGMILSDKDPRTKTVREKFCTDNKVSVQKIGKAKTVGVVLKVSHFIEIYSAFITNEQKWKDSETTESLDEFLLKCDFDFLK